jgi:hypothetical protein
MENYVTHAIDLKKLKANKDLVIDHILERGTLGKNATRKTATDFVEKLIEKKGSAKQAFASFIPKDAPKHYGAIEYQRILDLPKEVLRRDKEMIQEYITNAYKRFATGEQFGIQNQKLSKLFSKLSGDERAKFIEDTTLRALDLNPRDEQVEGVLGGIRGFQGLTKLGTAAISNITQSVNTASKYGVRRTAKNIAKQILDPDIANKFAIEAGAESGIESGKLMLESQGLLPKLLSNIGAPGFKQVEMANRSIAANTARDYADDLLRKVLKGDAMAGEELAKMGVDVGQAIQNGRITSNELSKIAQAGTKATQFTVSPLDLPQVFTGSVGKVVTQFKNFGYKQAEFVVNEVVKQAMKGNFKPLIRYKVIGIGAGEVSGDMKSFITGRRRPTNVQERKIENLANVGGAGIISDFYNSLKYGEEGVLKWLAGPTISEGATVLSGVGEVIQGRGAKTLYGQALRDIPIIGPGLKRYVYPNATEKKSKLPGLPGLLPRL